MTGDEASQAWTRLHDLTELLLGAAPHYRYAEAAAAAGIDLDRADQLWQSLGLAIPDRTEVLFTDADVQALRLAGVLTDRGLAFGDELATARAWAQSMARLSEWQVDLLRVLVAAEAARHIDPGDAGRGALDVAAEFLPVLDQLQQYVWRRHLLASADRLIGTISRSAESAPRVIGFADIVGFTDVSRGLTVAALARFVEDFEARSSAVITSQRGRVIKMIGDEVMFEVDEPAQAAEIALELSVLPSSLDERPNLHVGMAYGSVLHQFGDVFGTVVNLASRLTSLARPGSVLVDTELAAALGDDGRYTVRELRSVTMRGFERVRPWLLRSARVPRADRR